MAIEYEMLGVRRAAQQLGIHENTLRRWAENGHVQAIRLPSGVRRFRAEDIAALREQIYEPTEAHQRGIEAAASSLRTSANA